MNHSIRNRLAVLSLYLSLLPMLALLPNADPPRWTLVFSDSFDGTGINPNHWNTQYWFGRTIADNGELEWYQDDDVLVQNGILRLRAEQRNTQGYRYTSGMIASQNKFSFTYGYVEACVKVPHGKGFWPAFWLLPASENWPPEIDIFEIMGSQTKRVSFNVHYANSAGQNGQAGSGWTGPDFAEDWHLFAVDWEPGSIRWYVDGTEHWRYEGPGVPAEPMYIVADLAVGGDWPGSPDSRSVFPSYFDIRHIKVWQESPNVSDTMTPSSTLSPSATMVVDGTSANAKMDPCQALVGS